MNTPSEAHFDYEDVKDVESQRNYWNVFEKSKPDDSICRVESGNVFALAKILKALEIQLAMETINKLT